VRKLGNLLTVGFVSGDFRTHSVAKFILPVLKEIDKGKFRVFAYSEARGGDAVTAQIRALVDGWRDTAGRTADDCGAQIRADGVDVLVDLAGHSSGNRLDIFRVGPAPVTMTWLGWGYSTGIDCIDYFICDEVLVPVDAEHLFVEKPLRLKVPFAYVAPSEAPEVTELPALETGFVVFGCFSRSIRMNERVLGAWARILKAVPQAKLALNSADFSHPTKYAWVEKFFAAAGIGRERLVLKFSSPPWEAMQKVDIMLDCFPHNSGTTLVEGLHMGLPFVTLIDRPSVGRFGACLLAAIGHPEWGANTEDEYVEIAVQLAGDLFRLKKIRAALRSELAGSQLCDVEGFTREMEWAFRHCVERAK